MKEYKSCCFYLFIYKFIPLSGGFGFWGNVGKGMNLSWVFDFWKFLECWVYYKALVWIFLKGVYIAIKWCGPCG